MATAKITPDLDAVVARVEIAAPPERVFQALIEPAQLKLWFNDASCPVKHWEFEGRRGGRYRYETDRSATVSVNGVNEFKCRGEVLEFDPPRLLVYSWIANWHADPAQCHGGAMGTRAERRRHQDQGQGDPQRPRPGEGSARGLQPGLDWCGGKAA
jgi:uncharacterized protein YndB with AHSA1/START domain